MRMFSSSCIYLHRNKYFTKNVLSMNEVFDESSKEKQMIDRMDPEAATRSKAEREEIET